MEKRGKMLNRNHLNFVHFKAIQNGPPCNSGGMVYLWCESLLTKTRFFYFFFLIFIYLFIYFLILE